MKYKDFKKCKTTFMKGTDSERILDALKEEARTIQELRNLTNIGVQSLCNPIQKLITGGKIERRVHDGEQILGLVSEVEEC